LKTLRTFSPDGSGISDFKKTEAFRRSFLIEYNGQQDDCGFENIVFCSKKKAA
jgi:hypothetical protein